MTQHLMLHLHLVGSYGWLLLEMSLLHSLQAYVRVCSVRTLIDTFVHTRLYYGGVTNG